MSCCNRRRTQGSLPRNYLVAVVAVALLLLSSGDAGAEPIQLTTSGSLKFSPAFIRGGEELVYVEAVKPTQLQLSRLRLSDRAVTPLHKDVSQHELDFAVSRDGSHYAFVKCHTPLSLSLQMFTADEQKVGEVPPGPGFAGYRSPSFAPDNSRLLYAFPEDTHQHIFSVSLRGDDRVQLTSGPASTIGLSSHPDGREIVFASTRDGNYELYRMRADGGEVVRLTDSETMDLRPRFSPDGRRICFTSNRDGNYEIYLIDVDGSHLARVTSNPETRRLRRLASRRKAVGPRLRTQWSARFVS